MKPASANAIGRNIALGIGAALVTAMSISASALTLQEAAGKRLYTEGVGAPGPALSARVGLTDVVVPAAAVPCVNCHGRDGLGTVEAGIVTPAITWTALTKPYGLAPLNGKRHQAITRNGVIRAVAKGIAPAGRRLDPTMPRYSLSRTDAENLIAYLQRLESDLDPGLDDASITVATMLPTQGVAGGSGRIVQRVLQGAVADVNTRGIYGRRIELITLTYVDDPREALAKAELLLDRGKVFALLAPMLLGREAQAVALAETRQLPTIAPFGASELAAGEGRYTFHVFAGLKEQARVLVRYAAQNLSLARTPAAIVYPSNADVAVVNAVREQATALGWRDLETVVYQTDAWDPKPAIARLSATRTQAVFFLGAERELSALIQQAATKRWQPFVFLAGALAADAASLAPPSFTGRLFLALPMLPIESPMADSAFARFQQRHGLPQQHLASQVFAYAAATLFFDGLRRSGKALSRERFVSSLETVRGLATGVTPPLNLGPSRRTAALGGYVVALNTGRDSSRSVSEWIALED